MTKNTHKAVVVPINREPHPDADSLSVVKVGPLTVVIRTEDWTGEDKAVYIPPQNLVDTTRPEFAWLSHLCKKDTTKALIKPVKLRGVYSHGCFVKCPEGFNIGDDLTEYFGLEHYEPELKTSTGGEVVNGGVYNTLRKYDIDSALKFKLDPTIDVVCTEKIDGANMRVYCSEDGEIFVGSRSQWMKRDPKNSLWRAFEWLTERSTIVEWLKKNPNHILYGECYGPIQKLKYGLKSPRFAAFDIMTPNMNYLDYNVFDSICNEYNVPRTPEVYRGKNVYDVLEPYSHGQSLMPEADHIREGIVVRPLVEMRDDKFNRIIYKIVNPEFKQ